MRWGAAEKSEPALLHSVRSSSPLPSLHLVIRRCSVLTNPHLVLTSKTNQQKTRFVSAPTLRQALGSTSVISPQQPPQPSTPLILPPAPSGAWSVMRETQSRSRQFICPRWSNSGGRTELPCRHISALSVPRCSLGLRARRLPLSETALIGQV